MSFFDVGAEVVYIDKSREIYLGRVTEINEGAPYGVKCEFKNRPSLRFTADGKLHRTDRRQSLFLASVWNQEEMR